MTNKTLIAKAVKVALYSSLAASLSIGAPAFAAEGDDDAEVVEVTGSRLKRTDVEGANPVTIIDREQIELSGEISAADLLRNTTFNTTGSYRPQSGSSAQGTAAIDLRGIGSSRSLVLVDGRRLTMSPSTGNNQDLNSIPIGAIERIEILSDGASAIYGSDAIGGVVNVITRKDFNGAELSLSQGSPSIPADGGDREGGSFTFGASGDTTSIIGGVSWNRRGIVFERDFPWVTPAGSLYGNNWIGDYTQADSFHALPGSCNEVNFFIADDGLCRFNYNSTNANEASSDNESMYLKVRHSINDDWELYANASIAKTKSFGRYAPAPDSNFFYGTPIAEDSYNNPTNPNAWFYDANNPNAVAYDVNEVGPNRIIDIFHRFAAAGNRDNTVDNENTDFLVGATGFIGDTEVDFGARRVRNHTTEVGNGYLAGLTAWGFVNDFNPGYNSDGTVFDPDTYRYGYDIQTPSSNPTEVLRGSVVTTSRIGDFDINEYFASATFDIAEMDAGTIQMFVGAERREEYYSDAYDAQSEAGLVGGSSGNSAGGGRSVNSVFFETLFPFADNFDVSLAGRYDKYSDYGNDFSPKVSMRWSPTDDLVVRASYGQGFRAPSLDILTQETAFSADSVFDPASCTVFGTGPDSDCQVNAYRLANPGLESEHSDQYAVGLAYNVTDWFNMTLDYYNIAIDNRIAFFSSQNLVDRDLRGDVIPPGLGVYRDGNGLIERIDTGYGNEGDLKTSGVDFNGRMNFNFDDMGSLTTNLQLSNIIDYTIDGGRNLVKDPGTPPWRANLNNVYTLGDFQFAWNVSSIATQYTDVDSVELNDAGIAISAERSGNWGTWTTHDIQVNYNTSWDGRVTVGVQNVFEKLPKLEAFDGRDYNFYLYNGYGRITYVRYSQTF